MSIKHGDKNYRYGAYLICDCCGERKFFEDNGGGWIDPSFDAAVAFKKNPENGWKCIKRGSRFIDLCPECNAAYKEKIRSQRLGSFLEGGKAG